MKRILINATQNEEIRVALCTGNHLYDFDLENRTREQKKSNIYKGHVTRVEPSLEAVFVEYGSQRQGFLPIREISSEYLSGNPRDENIKKLIKEGDELIVQVEKEERGNKGAALSTYVSLAGRYLVLMPNNPRGGGISRQISGKLREDMKRMLGNLDLPKGMSVIIRTAGIGKTQEDLQHDLNHLLNIWQAIQEQNQKYPSPRLVHQEAGVVTRAVRDYLRDDIAEIWIDNENAYIEAAGFIDAVMPKQAEKLRKYTDYEPMFSRFGIEKQIETAYQREVRLPSGGSIVIDQTEALVSIDINSAKSTKGSDVAETAYHTNLEAADEIARQLRLRDMGGLIVIDFIDMNDNKHQKEVEKRLIDATKYDRARVQFGEISKFGLMEMSRQRLRPSLEESTGYICPRCHGNGMIRDLRSLSLSIMRQIEQIALKERQGEVQAEVPTDIAAFLLNEKRDSLVYLEQDSGTRITILPHAHLESPNFKLHFNRDGFAPTSYERITDTQQQEHSDLGYNVDWQTAEKERPEQQPTRQPRKAPDTQTNQNASSESNQPSQRSQQTNDSQATPNQQSSTVNRNNDHNKNGNAQATVNKAVPSNSPQTNNTQGNAGVSNAQNTSVQNNQPAAVAAQPQTVAWLSNLFAQAPQAQTSSSISSRDAAEAIETLVNSGAQSLGSLGQVDSNALSGAQSSSSTQDNRQQSTNTNQQNARQQDDSSTQNERQQAQRNTTDDEDRKDNDNRKRKPRKSRPSKPRQRKDQSDETINSDKNDSSANDNTQSDTQDKHEQDSKRGNDRNRNRNDNTGSNSNAGNDTQVSSEAEQQTRAKRKPHSQRSSRGNLERGETLAADNSTHAKQNNQQTTSDNNSKSQNSARRSQNPNEVVLQVSEAPAKLKASEVVHLSLDNSKSELTARKSSDIQAVKSNVDISDKDDSRTVASKSDSVDIASEETVHAQTDVVDTAVSTDTTNEKAQVDASIVNQATDVKTPLDEQSVPSKTETDTKSHIQVEDNAHLSLATNEGATQSQQVSNDKVTIELTHDALFAKRYVTANKFGQASNDPRVVRQLQAQLTPVVEINQQTVITIAPAIRGTVGQFIHATLAESQKRLDNEGVINCFIAAIETHQQQAQSTIVDDHSTESHSVDHNSENSSSDDSFDFSNYGYQPLAADYLARFDTMTQAVSQFGSAQGKTTVEPRVVGQRASNDPRGQHPDYQAQAVSTIADESKVESDQEDAEPQAVSEIIATDSTAAMTVQATDTQFDNQVDAHDVEATALAAQADEVSTDSEQRLQADVELHSEQVIDSVAAVESVAEPVKDDSQVSKSKTTIASYKNMIENVAEQLSPQTGMFNLTTPKVPKARSRKTKTEHKKPTQAEKLESDNSDGDS